MYVYVNRVDEDEDDDDDDDEDDDDGVDDDGDDGDDGVFLFTFNTRQLSNYFNKEVVVLTARLLLYNDNDHAVPSTVEQHGAVQTGAIPKTHFHIQTFHPFQFPDDEVTNWFQQGLNRRTISILAFKGNVTSRVPNAGWGGVPIPAGIALPSRHILAGTQPSGFIIRQSHWATWCKRFVRSSQ